MSQWLPDWSLLLKYISPGAVADVFLIGYLIYRLLLVARGTRALQVMGGLIVFFGDSAQPVDSDAAFPTDNDDTQGAESARDTLAASVVAGLCFAM